GEEPAAQIRARLPQMRVGEGSHQGILNQIVRIGLFPLPATNRAAQKRNFLFNLPCDVRMPGFVPGADRAQPRLIALARVRGFAAWTCRQHISLPHPPKLAVNLLPICDTRLGRKPLGARATASANAPRNLDLDGLLTKL